MPVNFSTLVYLPNYEYWARPITVTPSGGGTSYVARGIFDTDELDVILEDGSRFSDQKTLLHIRIKEFSVLPKQHDLISIPAVEDIDAEGEFEVKDASNNGGGEMTLTLVKVEDPKP